MTATSRLLNGLILEVAKTGIPQHKFHKDLLNRGYALHPKGANGTVKYHPSGKTNHWSFGISDKDKKHFSVMHNVLKRSGFKHIYNTLHTTAAGNKVYSRRQHYAGPKSHVTLQHLPKTKQTIVHHHY